MDEEIPELIPVSKVPPLTDSVNNNTFNMDTLKTMRNLCAKGREIQDMITAAVPDSFFIGNLRNDSEYLLITLQLLNNLCVQNEENQMKLFEKVVERFPTIKWETATAKAALHFIITCTREESPFQKEISIDLLLPFLNLEDDDELEFLIITLFPTIILSVIDYALTHEDMCVLLLDRVYDAIQEQPESVEDIPAVISKLLSLIKQDRLQIKRAKSNIVGIFCVLVGLSETAREEALKQDAQNIFLETKKIDIEDPVLLEYCVAALRILQGNID